VITGTNKNVDGWSYSKASDPSCDAVAEEDEPDEPCTDEYTENKGKLEISEDTTIPYCSVRWIRISGGAKVTAPNLQTTNRIDLFGGTLDAPKLKTVKYDCMVSYSAGGNPTVLNASKLQSVGALYVNPGGVVNAPKLTTVSGGNDPAVVVSENATLNAPEITTIQGDVTSYSLGVVSFPKLTDLGGNVVVSNRHGAGGVLNLPLLSTVHIDVYVYNGTTLNAPALTTVEGTIHKEATGVLNAPNLKGV
jgi:hypothetical protein